MHSPHNHPDIKIGEIYNLHIHVVGKREDFIIARPITQNGGYATSSFLEILHKYAPSFTPLPSEHGTSVPTPKHDPCRLFKKGDKVRVVECKGRNCTERELGSIGEIVLDEGEDDPIYGIGVYFEDGSSIYVDPAYLELVNPVEELGPYVVRHNEAHAAWSIYGPFDLSAVNYFYGEHYPYTKDTAKKAAEAERDRLNAEWIKKHTND